MKRKTMSIVCALFLIPAVFLITAFAAVMGDANGDNDVTAADARIALRCAVGLEKVSAETEKLIDVNGDKAITAADARLILRAAVGLENLGEPEPPAHEHSWNDGEIVKEATCTEEGKLLRTCTECGKTDTVAIPMRDHTPVVDPAVPATCLENGSTEGSHCGECGKVFVAPEVIPTLGHTWNEGVVTKEPTTTSAGMKTYTCVICGDTYTEKLHILDLQISPNNEYDIYRSGSFYIKGSLFDGVSRQPMEIGMDGDVIYMTTEYKGAQIAGQLVGQDLYMIIPSEECFHKMDKTELEALEMNERDLIPIDPRNFRELPSLQDADSITEGICNGRPCILYSFDMPNGCRFVVAMDGDKLLYTENYTASGNFLDGMYFDSVSASMPERMKEPGAGNKRILMVTTFMTILQKFMQQ